MEDTFDSSKESRRVVTQFGRPNDRQVTESDQRDQEREARTKDGSAEKDRKS